MESADAPKPAPIIDVAPPSKAAEQPLLARPPAADAPAKAPRLDVAKSENHEQPDPVGQEATPSNRPVLAIALAIGLFVALSAVAYYAYSKSN